jgi:hypothetical protein
MSVFWQVIYTKDVKPGEQCPIVFSADNYGDCVNWISDKGDPESAHAGDYQIDPPEHFTDAMHQVALRQIPYALYLQR